MLSRQLTPFRILFVLLGMPPRLFYTKWYDSMQHSLSFLTFCACAIVPLGRGRYDSCERRKLCDRDCPCSVYLSSSVYLRLQLLKSSCHHLVDSVHWHLMRCWFQHRVLHCRILTITSIAFIFIFPFFREDRVRLHKERARMKAVAAAEFAALNVGVTSPARSRMLVPTFGNIQDPPQSASHSSVDGKAEDAGL